MDKKAQEKLEEIRQQLPMVLIRQDWSGCYFKKLQLAGGGMITIGATHSPFRSPDYNTRWVHIGDEVILKRGVGPQKKTVAKVWAIECDNDLPIIVFIDDPSLTGLAKIQGLKLKELDIPWHRKK